MKQADSRKKITKTLYTSFQMQTLLSEILITGLQNH